MVCLLEDTMPLSLRGAYCFSNEKFSAEFMRLINSSRSCHEVQQVFTDQKGKCHKDDSHWQAWWPPEGAKHQGSNCKQTQSSSVTGCWPLCSTVQTWCSAWKEVLPGHFMIWESAGRICSNTAHQTALVLQCLLLNSLSLSLLQLLDVITANKSLQLFSCP